MFKWENLQNNNTEFNGIYLGVVEDNVDPNKAGRVRVRIAGLHSENKINSEDDGIPTNGLPWAIPAVPIAEGGASGNGIFSVPVQGSWIVLFFIGGDHNNPVYFASIAGFPKTKRSSNDGFSDPSGKYPLILNEPDWAPNARNSGTIIKHTTTTGPEPTSSYATQYPYNTVWNTRDNGPMFEMDATPDAERLHLYHKASDSYMLIHPNGDFVTKSTSNSYIVADGNLSLYSTRRVDIDGGTGEPKGVVQGGCLCPFTGAPHINTSGNVNASQ